MSTIKAIRVRLGITQAAMAEGMGCTQANVSFYEKGQAIPPVAAKRLIAFAKTLGHIISFDDIYGEALGDQQAIPEPPQPAPPEDEAAEPLQPMDLAGQCDNNRRALPQEPDALEGQPPDIDGEAEETRAPATALAALTAQTNAANGTLPPPPDFSGQDENGRLPAAPAGEADDSQPVLVLDETDDRKAA